MTFIDDLYLDGNVKFHAEYFRGSVYDRIGGDLPTVTGITSFAKSKQQLGISFFGNQVLSYADSAARRLNGGACSMVIVGMPQRQGDWARRMVCKRDVGGCSYDLYTPSTSAVELFDGTISRFITANLLRRRCFALSLTNGSAAQGYLDGTPLGAFSGASTIAADDAPLLIGNLYTLGNGAWSGSIQNVMLLSRVLTSREHSVLYEEMISQTSVLRTFGPVQPPAMVADSAAPLAYDLSVRTAAGLVPNLGTLGPTYDATVVPPATASSTGMQLAKESGLTVTAGMTPITSDDTHAVEFVVKLDSVATVPVVVSSATADAYWIGKTAADAWEWRCGGATRRFTGRSVGQWCHIVANKTAAGDSAEFYCNGVPLATAAGSLGNKGADVTALLFGRYMSAGQGCVGKGQRLQLHSTSLTNAQVQQKLRAIARTPYQEFDVSSVPVTLANVTVAGATIPGTQYRVTDGQWAVKNRLYTANGERKREAWIECIAAGSGSLARIVRQQDPGTRRWRFRMYCSGSVSFNYGLIADTRSIPIQNGYYLQVTSAGTPRILEYTAGGAGVPITGAAGIVSANTWYDVDVSLRFDGLFSAWYRKTGSKTWGVLLSGTDTTRTLGQYQITMLDVGSRLGGPCAEYLFGWNGVPE